MLNEYDKREAYLVYQHSLMRDFKEEGKLEGIKEGKLEGLKEGEKNKSILIAKNLKKSGLDAKFISENTGLSIEEVEKL